VLERALQKFTIYFPVRANSKVDAPGRSSREAIHNVANTLQFARNGAVGFIVGHYSPSMILRIAIIARTPAAVGVIAKLIISAADIVIVLDSRN